MHNIGDALWAMAKAGNFWQEAWEIPPGQSTHVEAVEANEEERGRPEINIENRTKDVAFKVFLLDASCDTPQYFVEIDSMHVITEQEADRLPEAMQMIDKDPVTGLEECNLTEHIESLKLDLKKAEDLPKIKSVVLQVMHAMGLMCFQTHYAGSNRFVLYREGAELRLREEDEDNYSVVGFQPAGDWAMNSAYVMSVLDSGERE